LPIDNQYDVIIIGAGMSGLAAGIRLAYYDKKVLICEKHSTLGGLNSFYKRKGNVLDVGLHAMTNFADKKERQQPLNKLLRQLKIQREDLQLIEQNKSLIHFPENKLHFTNSIDLLIEEINRDFPNDTDGFIKLIDYVKSYDSLSLENKDFVSTRETLKSFLKSDTLANMLLCPLMYYGSSWENDIDFAQFSILFKSIFLEGFSRPQAGITSFLNTLENKFLKNGGTLKFRSEVTEITSKDKKVCGIKLKNGEEYNSKDVISSCGLLETELLTQSPLSDKDALPGEMTFTEIIFLLKNHIDKNPEDGNTITFFNNKNSFDYKKPDNLVSLNSGVICSPDNFISSDRHRPMLRVTNLANHNLWFNLHRDDYKDQKNEIISNVIDRVSTLVNFSKDNIEYTDMFTPKTVKKYTSHINGTVYGSTTKLKSGKTSIENLYISGTDQGFLGIVGALLSGISISNSYCLR
jgi:phytoene dehydrogenase-like protein